jgi:signal transduction histidine kinase/CheY-like chemotaxis protein
MRRQGKFQPALDHGNTTPDRAATPAQTAQPPATSSATAPDRLKHGMGLPLRLLLLILICLLPMVAAQLFVQVDLRQARDAQLRELAMHQADLANGDLISIVEGARQLAAAAGQLVRLVTLDLTCSEQMATLRRDLPAYKFIAVYNSTGQAVCASNPTLTTDNGPRPDWISDLLRANTFRIGTYTTMAGIDGPFLPMGLPMSPPAGQRGSTSGADPPVVVVVALDLDWLNRHLAELRFNRSKLLANAGLVIIDRNGNALARLRGPGGNPDRKVRPPTLALIHRDAPGVATIEGYDGRARIIAYIPTTVPPRGLAIVAAFYPPDMTADIDKASQREIEFAALSTALALVLTMLAARRFIIGPTERLLAAARRWREGDLSARADVGEQRSEFGALASSFNAMAAALHARELERLQQAEQLEAVVKERTKELSESNNRLQVEIAERERTEVALHQAQKLQAVGQLAGGVAHDFNNLLATILGNLELMERRIGSGRGADEERLQGLIERATGAVQRGAQLTARLLTFARRQRLAPQATDLNRLIADVVALATGALGRRIQVVTDLAPDLRPALVDPSQVEAAILNLCLNARDAMPDGGRITIVTANETTVASGGGSDGIAPGAYIRLSVIDTGSGMTPEVQRRAFEPFFTTKGPEGSGLGLSQVYGLARQSGGTVRLSSAPNRGTEVTILLPHAVEEAETARVEPNMAPLGGPIPPTLALVVDDDAAVRQVTLEMLRALGCEVMGAADGAEALTLLSDAASGVDILMIDYAMPGMNGLKLAAAVRELNIDAPIVLITGYAEMADPSASAADPISGMLRKPFTIRDMQAMLIRLRRLPQRSSNVVRLPTPKRG